MKRKWRRLDEPGLELFELTPTAEGYYAASSIVHAGKNAFALRYLWHLDRKWRTRRLSLFLAGSLEREMTIERDSGHWIVDGHLRSELDQCEEIDLSATPFCNTLAIKRLGGAGELVTLYVDLPALSLSASRQRYEQLELARWRYIDLGVAKGFEARIDVDRDDFVSSYEQLFEAIK